MSTSSNGHNTGLTCLKYEVVIMSSLTASRRHDTIRYEKKSLTWDQKLSDQHNIEYVSRKIYMKKKKLKRTNNWRRYQLHINENTQTYTENFYLQIFIKANDDDEFQNLLRSDGVTTTLSYLSCVSETRYEITHTSMLLRSSLYRSLSPCCQLAVGTGQPLIGSAIFMFSPALTVMSLIRLKSILGFSVTQTWYVTVLLFSVIQVPGVYLCICIVCYCMLLKKSWRIVLKLAVFLWKE